jgi:hypothetical protein
MLPSLGGRIASIIGIVAGLAALFLADWGIDGVPKYAWKVLSALAVVCLLVRRQFPNKAFDDKVLRARVGDAPVNRLNACQNAAMALLTLGLVIAIALAPFVATAFRHGFTLAALGALLTALTIYAYVEVRFRALLSNAGLFDAPQPPR